MTARIFAFLVWAVLAACVAFWGLRLTSRPAAVPVHASPVTGLGSAQGDLTRLFGAGAAVEAAPAAAPATASNTRFKLLGTFAAKGREAEAGWATVSVDNGPARTYGIGATLAGTELVLQQVSLRGARIGPEGGAATVTLELPALPAAATGRLPDALSGGAGQAPAGLPPGAQPAPRAMQALPMAAPPPVAPPADVQPPPQQPPVMPQMVQRNEAPDPTQVPPPVLVAPQEAPPQAPMPTN